MAASQLATFECAFERLKESVKPHHAIEFQSTTLKDVWDAANEIQRIQRQRSSLRNMGRLKPFLQGLEKYSKCLDTLCNGTPFLPWVWAPVKLILQLASDHPIILDKLLEAYSQIANVLPRFDRFQSAFDYDANVSQALALVYEDILEFHRNTYLFLRRGAWHIFFDSLWKDFGARFLGILENLERHRDLVDREASTIAIIEAKKWRAKQQDNLEQLEDERRDRQLQDCISWLAIDDRSQEDALEKLSDLRQEGTCDWILESSQLRTWVEDRNAEPVLWLKGIPGAGKSVLTSHVIQKLRENSDFTTVFFFCNSRTDSVDLCSQVLRTLILELLRSQHHLTSHIFEHFARQRQTPSLGQIKKLLPDLLSAVSSVRIVIDGLDECQEKSQKVILTELLSAAKASTSTCKIFLSSRVETFISKAMRKKPIISLTEKREKTKVDEDIRDYVRHSLMPLRDNFPGTLVDDVERTVVRKAQGMFLWVRLVISELSDRESAYELRKAAHNLPQGLHEAYRRILDRIQSDYSTYSSEKAILILQWMACSFRPLKTFEIQDGLVFATSDCVLNDDTKSNKSLLDLCKPIVEEGVGNTVDFVHFSAKEYILHQTSGPFLKECEAHLTVAFACASYLSTSQCIIDSRYSEEEQVLSVAKGFHSLHLYAHEFMLKHVLRYAELQALSKLKFSEALATRLEALLRFEKPVISGSLYSGVHKHTNLPETVQQFLTANLSSSLRAFIQNLLNFREFLAQDNHRHNAPQGNSLRATHTPKPVLNEHQGLMFTDIYKQEIERDPTVLSQILHQYHTITEFLIESSENGISGIDATIVRSFKDTYGHSALLCRYRPCPRTSVGFSRVRDRDKHESSHTRKFECEDASCEFHESGFSTKSALQKHTQMYHRKLDDTVLPIRRRVNAMSLRERFLDSSDSSSMSDRPRREFSQLNLAERRKITRLEKQSRASAPSLNIATSRLGPRSGRTFSAVNFDTDQNCQDADTTLRFEEPPVSLFQGTKLNLSGYKERQLKKLDLRQAQHLPSASTPDPASNKVTEEDEMNEVQMTNNRMYTKEIVTLNSTGRKKRKDYPSSWECPSITAKKRLPSSGPWEADYESRQQPQITAEPGLDHGMQQAPQQPYTQMSLNLPANSTENIDPFDLLAKAAASNQHIQGLPTLPHGFIDDKVPPATMSVEDWIKFFEIEGDNDALDAPEGNIDLFDFWEHSADLLAEAAASNQHIQGVPTPPHRLIGASPATPNAKDWFPLFEIEGNDDALDAPEGIELPEISEQLGRSALSPQYSLTNGSGPSQITLPSISDQLGDINPLIELGAASEQLRRSALSPQSSLTNGSGPSHITLPSISDQLGDINPLIEPGAASESSFSQSPPRRLPPRFSAVPSLGSPKSPNESFSE
ncbi:hypothetical protein BKA65DRAFT_587311 [Rhexocercosporidium sp. MPI-PUGE-AT-0058]|nr:hypothetical protein BKA65DRAFT_587311 [Rhexocercosporidium sp. MPI-PUGE-AT-0058]